MLFDSDEHNHAVLTNRQPCTNIDTYKNIPILLTWSTVEVQHEDGGCWMHGTVVGYRSDDNHGRSYKKWVTKMGFLITRTRRHIRNTPITAEKHLRSKVSRKEASSWANRLDDHVQWHTKAYWHEEPKKFDTVNYSLYQRAELESEESMQQTWGVL